MQAVLSIMCVGTCIAVFSQRLTLGRFNANRWFWLLSEQEWFYERAFLMFMGARGPSLALKKACLVGSLFRSLISKSTAFLRVTFLASRAHRARGIP